MTDSGQDHAGLGHNESARRDPAYVRSVLLTLCTAVTWSMSGLVWRNIEDTPIWTVIFYRSISLFIALALILLFRYRGRMFSACRSIGVPGLCAGFFLGSGTVLFLFAVMNTTIANVSFLTAATPMAAAILGWWLLKERVRRATWISMIVALLGVLVMVYEGIAEGGWFGNSMAILAALSSAGYVIALRFGRRVDQMPAVMFGGFVAFFLAMFFVADFRISLHDYAMCATQGVIISAFCNVVFAYSARSLPAAEITVLSLLEVCLAPTWVWWFLGEEPSTLALFGGAILLTSVLAYSASTIRS